MPLPNSNTLEEGSSHSLRQNHPAPAARLTPFQSRPIQSIAVPKTDRKHKRQKSEVLTSTPVKADRIKIQEDKNKEEQDFVN